MKIDIDLSKAKLIFLIDTLKAIYEKKARIGQKHYRTTIYNQGLNQMIKDLELNLLRFNEKED